MKTRCSNPNYKHFEFYGGKGVKIDPRWLEPRKGFKNFLADMGPRPSPNHQLDREDADGDYTPENCRWLEKHENQSRAQHARWAREKANAAEAAAESERQSI